MNGKGSLLLTGIIISENLKMSTIVLYLVLAGNDRNLIACNTVADSRGGGGGGFGGFSHTPVEKNQAHTLTYALQGYLMSRYGF